MFTIVRKVKMNEAVELMEIFAPYIAQKCQAGQFVILRVNAYGERVPLTIADYDRHNKTIVILYQKVGYSTKQLSLLEVGDTIRDVAGPLGNPVHFDTSKHVIGVGGGVGSAPLYPQVRALVERGIKVDVILGAKSASYILWQERFRKLCNKVHIVTDDGSLGTKGFVTTVLEEQLQEYAIDQVIAIGPVPMMKAVVSITKPKNIKTSVSLNPIMIDGTGMCGCCRVSIGDKTKFACIDGPDFDGFLVDFDELRNRQQMFMQEEKVCNRTGEIIYDKNIIENKNEGVRSKR